MSSGVTASANENRTPCRSAAEENSFRRSESFTEMQTTVNFIAGSRQESSSRLEATPEIVFYRAVWRWVEHDERMSKSLRSLRVGSRRVKTLIRGFEAHRHGKSSALAIGRADASAQAFDVAAHDPEAKAVMLLLDCLPARRRLGRPSAGGEPPLEDRGQVLGRDAWPLVGDGQMGIAPRDDQHDIDRLTVLGIARGILQQVLEDRFHRLLAGICVDVVFDRGTQMLALRAQGRLIGGDKLRDTGGGIDATRSSIDHLGP